MYGGCLSAWMVNSRSPSRPGRRRKQYRLRSTELLHYERAVVRLAARCSDGAAALPCLKNEAMSKTKPAASARSGAGCMMLFALPFIVCGVTMGGCGAWTAAKVRDAQSWAEVPAVIKTAELKHGDDTDRAVATYEYEFGGRKHTSDRVSFHRGNDNIGSFQRDAFRELNNHRKPGRAFRCFVNPQDPAESVLYRNVRWEMMLLYCGVAVLFGGAGVAIFTTSLVALTRHGPPLSGGDVSEQPWTARADWASGRVGPSDAALAALPATIAVAIWWMLASAPIFATWPLIQNEAGTRWSWLVLAIPALAILVVCIAVYLAIRSRRFGESVFEMASVPGVIGGPLSGIVRIAKLVQPESGFRLKLLCMSQSRDSEGDKQHERVLWQDERFVAKAMSGDGFEGVAVPVLMAIPFTARPTTGADGTPRIRWLLEIFAALPGVNYKTEFEVPVFKTADSRQDFQIDEQLAAEYSSAPDNDMFLREAGIIKEPGRAGGVRLVFPAARNLGSSLVMALLAVGLCGGAWFMFHNGVMFLFPIFFGLFGLFFTLIAIESLFYRSVVEASAVGLTVRGGLFGIGRTRTYSPEDVTRFTSAENMSSGKHVWCTISVETRSDKSRTIGKGISSKLAEQAVIDELNAALGRKVPVEARPPKSVTSK